MQNEKINFKVSEFYEDYDARIWKCIESNRHFVVLLRRQGEIAVVNSKGIGKIITSTYDIEVKITKQIVPKREVWINLYEDQVGNAYPTKEEADKFACIKRKDCICFIEK